MAPCILRLAATDANSRPRFIPATSKVSVVTYTPAHGVTTSTPHTPQRSSARNSRWLRRRSIQRTADRTGSGRRRSVALNTPVPRSARRKSAEITTAGSMLNTTDTTATSAGSNPRSHAQRYGNQFLADGRCGGQRHRYILGPQTRGLPNRLTIRSPAPPVWLLAATTNNLGMTQLIVLAVALQGGGEPADLSFLAYLDVWLIGGLVLLAVVVVVGKWLYGRFRRRPDDDMYYDERYDDYDYEC